MNTQAERRAQRSRNIIFYAVLAALLGAGWMVGILTEKHYTLWVRGIVGLLVLYYLWAEYMLPARVPEPPTGLNVQPPRDLKLLPFAFYLGIVCTWAGAGIGTAIGCYLLR